MSLMFSFALLFEKLIVLFKILKELRIVLFDDSADVLLIFLLLSVNMTC